MDNKLTYNATVAVASNVFYRIIKYRIHICVFSFIFLLTFYNSYLHLTPDWPVMLSFFLWNVALYLFDRAYDSRLDVISQPQEAITEKERVPFLVFSIALSFVPFLILGFSGKPVWPYLFFLPITFLYTYPVFAGKRVKDFLLIKNLYSAVIIWPLPVVAVAYFYAGNTQVDFWHLMKDQLFPFFLYVMIGEAFWDIRDVHGDRVNGVNTIPVVFGTNYAKIYLYGLLVVDLLTSKFKFSEPFVIYCVLIFFVTPNSPRWVFHIPPLIALYRWVLSFN